eukprot:15357609-Ditylum_brightwellii.AAC.1
MEALQAETYGRIALFYFLHHFRIYKNSSNHPNSQHYFCDNSSLIAQLKYDQQSPQYHSPYTLANYDA